MAGGDEYGTRGAQVNEDREGRGKRSAAGAAQVRPPPPEFANLACARRHGGSPCPADGTREAQQE